jgi:hypothetical protein
MAGADSGSHDERLQLGSLLGADPPTRISTFAVAQLRLPRLQTFFALDS